MLAASPEFFEHLAGSFPARLRGTTDQAQAACSVLADSTTVREAPAEIGPRRGAGRGIEGAVALNGMAQQAHCLAFVGGHALSVLVALREVAQGVRMSEICRRPIAANGSANVFERHGPR